MSNPIDASIWQGRIDGNDQTTRRWHQVVKAWDGGNLNQACCLIGYACDEGVRRNKGRIGSKHAPNAIRQTLANLAYHNEHAVYDLGDITCDDDNLELAQSNLAELITRVLNHQGHPIVLGGGHDISWGSFLGLAQHLSATKTDRRIGIINFDAHFDLRPAQPQANSGSAFRQIAQWCQDNKKPFNYLVLGISEDSNTASLFEYAKEKQVSWQTDVDCTLANLDEIVRLLTDFTTRVDELYVTICMDVFPAYCCPGVSAPAALGIEPIVVIKLIQELKILCKLNQVDWRLSDIAELNPSYDQDLRSARLAARLISELSR